ncbi:MarR family winged helix-turn-helix transcriptional regulator [Gymnodinialimonas hymeniacidonis]|uniref:MarR family winged helix-turn-helix transcriptional regulator n=1 Tax=Gymnodinialimonas hymeniacidonis TaxID=3126508 RepID=UPI0034C62C6F
MTRDADLRRLVGYNIQRASSAVMGAVNRVLKPFGLRRASYSVLSVVVETPGLRQADVSEVLAIERPNLVQIIDGLEKAGWITRRRVEGDRRAYELHPTLAGRAHYTEARGALQVFDGKLTAQLDEAAVWALIDGLNAVEAAGPGAEEGEVRRGVQTP